jgi:hypothetical protein
MWRFGLSLLAYPIESKGVPEHGKKEYGKNEVHFYTLLTLSLDIGEWSV